jgi:hypothetical protein
MRRSTRTAAGILTLSLAVAAAPVPAGPPAGGEVTLRPVKYADLAGVVRGLKGKVVVVDFWADF